MPMLRIVEDRYTINDVSISKADLMEIRDTIPELPEGLRSCRYDGERHVRSDGANQSAGPVPWPEADALLADPDLAADIEALLNPPALEPTLTESIAAALQTIDDRAETARLRYITPGNGQSMVYQRKAEEAEKLQLDSSPDAANYPLLSAEIGITGATLADVAAAVLETRNLWLAAAGAIETERLTAKRAVAAAEDTATVAAVINALSYGDS